jgi:hypothetical protein
MEVEAMTTRGGTTTRRHFYKSTDFHREKGGYEAIRTKFSYNGDGAFAGKRGRGARLN